MVPDVRPRDIARSAVRNVIDFVLQYSIGILLTKEGMLSRRRSWGGRSQVTFRCERPPRRFAPPLLRKEGIVILKTHYLSRDLLSFFKIRIAPRFGLAVAPG